MRCKAGEQAMNVKVGDGLGGCAANTSADGPLN